MADLAEALRIDVIVLAECQIDLATMLMVLNCGPGSEFHLPAGPKMTRLESLRGFPGTSFDPRMTAADLEQEQQAGHPRTVLVGDFNMNPFESGMVGAAALHSAMSRQVWSRGSRTVKGHEYPFFYNPCGVIWAIAQ